MNDVVAILSTIILIVTILTLIFAIAGYSVFRIKEKLRSKAKATSVIITEVPGEEQKNEPEQKNEQTQRPATNPKQDDTATTKPPPTWTNAQKVFAKGMGIKLDGEETTPASTAEAPQLKRFKLNDVLNNLNDPVIWK